jgi:hypothetical protein
MTAHVAPWAFLLAVAGVVCLRARRAAGPNRGRAHDLALAALAVVALVVYLGSGVTPWSNHLNQHEWVHYYLGAKYEHELSYTRLYDCIDVADAQDGLAADVSQRQVTDLESNRIVTASAILAHPDACTRHFSVARWDAFRRDVRYFRAHVDAEHWKFILTDHGFNATPVWTTTATSLANLTTASDLSLRLLSLLDPLYMLGIALVVVWAFGWRTAAVAALVVAAYQPAQFQWIGGAFMRWDWIFFTVAAVCCLRRDRALLAGVALGYASLLRVFPGVLFVGPACVFAAELIRRGRVHRVYARMLGGGALAASVAIPLSWIVTDGATTWRAFAHNLAKTASTPFANAIGAADVLRWGSNRGLQHLYDPRAADPLATWRNAAQHAGATGMPVRVLVALGFVTLLVLAARRVEPWVATVLGVMMVPAVTDLLSYYWVLIAVAALLWSARPEAGIQLLALGALTQFIALAPLPGMPVWEDQQFVLMSLATVVVFGGTLWREAFPGARRSRTSCADPGDAELALVP